MRSSDALIGESIFRSPSFVRARRWNSSFEERRWLFTKIILSNSSGFGEDSGGRMAGRVLAAVRLLRHQSSRRAFSVGESGANPLQICVVGSGPAGFYTAEKVVAFCSNLSSI